MKQNIIPTKNLFPELDNIIDYKDLDMVLHNQKDIIIVTTKYHHEINNSLIADYITTIEEIDKKNSIGIVEVPGAFELVYAIKSLIKKCRPKLILTIGCIIKGETKHDDYLSSSIINSIQIISHEYVIPIINGILTTNTLEQAIDRAGKRYRKGKEYALASIDMLALAKSLD